VPACDVSAANKALIFNSLISFAKWRTMCSLAGVPLHVKEFAFPTEKSDGTWQCSRLVRTNPSQSWQV